MQITKPQLPDDLQEALPRLLNSGQIVFPADGYATLLQLKDVRVLPTLIDIWDRAPKYVKPEKPNFLQYIFEMDSYNHSLDVTRELIVAIASEFTADLTADNLWCTNCLQPSIRHGQLYNHSTQEYGVMWAACTECYDNVDLQPFEKVIGLVGNVSLVMESHFYIPFWDPVTKTTHNLDRPVNQIEIYPGLVDQLDWALTAVITALQNTSRGVPPIHLHTTQPLVENTRRLIAPYLNERSE